MPLGTFATCRWLLITLALASALHAQEAKVVETEGKVVITKAGSTPAQAEVGMGLAARDKLGTGESSRAVLQMSDKWFARVDEETDVEIMPGALSAKDKNALKLALGGAFIYSRDEEGEVKVQTPAATGGLRGTQLMVRVFADGRTVMQVVEGEVDLANDLGAVKLKAGEAGEAQVGQAPHKTAVIETRNLLQWALYYPAVLQPNELGLTGDEQKMLAASLAAYLQGDLLGALARYPADLANDSGAVRLYQAGVLLATGRVDAARAQLDRAPADSPGRRALNRMIAAVRFEEQPAWAQPTTASEALAESYYQQSRSRLDAARAAAKRATEISPAFGPAWIRLAELEFSFGRTHVASVALEKGMQFAPRDAEAHALRGFLLAADNRIAAARDSFGAAVRLDGGLGNGWLGLGLTKIKEGQLAGGLADLQTAATVEPTRALFYSYHGKALSLDDHGALARKDFNLAKKIDPADPTPWLYSAIENQQSDRYNDAVDDLQASIERNDNRQVFRSRFLLDQDAAVRSTNLASIYQDDGMTDLAVREATRAVDSDYTNASAHLFLANSFDALRDPELVSLRYQTAWFNELLLANLLSPVGGGPLSQYVSQQEYSKLFAADGAGGSSLTEWRSAGYFSQQVSLFANYGRLSVGADFLYHNNEGYRLNNDDLRKELWLQLKYEVSPRDMAYLLVHGRDQTGGDLFQSYSNASANTGLRFEDKQAPGLALAGWNHQWAPGLNTLFLGGRLAADQTVSAPNTSEFLFTRNDNSSILSLFGQINGVYGEPFNVATERRFTIGTAELQQIWKTNRNTLLAGARWQGGPFDTTSQFVLLDHTLLPYFSTAGARQDVRVDFERESVYAYDYLDVVPGLKLVAGGSWDRLKHPDNFRFPPVNGMQDTISRTNGKFGFTLTPSAWITLRGAYTEALGGVALDEDVRLEPVQFAGFNQAFRTVISESISSSVEAPVYWNKGLSAEGQLPTRTWWAVSYNDLHESVQRTIGVFDGDFSSFFPGGFEIFPSGTEEKLAYRERVFTAGLNQLIGRQFAVGATYRRTQAWFHDTYPMVPVALSVYADQVSTGSLNEFALTAGWNSPTGWFARAESHWYSQDLGAQLGGLPSPSPDGDNFWQHNFTVGHRFEHNRHEVSVGVLNLGDRDYHLSPLTYLIELPHNRTYFVRVRLGF
jgi:Flp pilus assembly protein TadD